MQINISGIDFEQQERRHFGAEEELPDDSYLNNELPDEEEEVESDSQDSDISIQNLLHSEEEKANYWMHGNSIYSESHLFKLCLACCLADCRHSLAIKILNVLLRIRDRQKALNKKSEKFMRYLDIVMALVYLR